jgi:hypothetical protein
VEGRLLLDGVVGEHFAEQLGVGVSGAASEHECLVAEPPGFVARNSAVIAGRSSRRVNDAVMLETGEISAS